MNATFNKSEHLKSRKAIDELFEKGSGFVVYPLRVLFAEVENVSDIPSAQVMVVAQKKRFKRAVVRNHIKRMMREAYRLHKQPFLEKLNEKQKALNIAFIAISNEIPTFDSIEKQMIVAINRLTESEL